MINFKLERTIHPVGHGGFVSETVSGRDFSVVFDCGSKGKNHDDLLTREINNLKRGTHFIDRLVISHFDQDHVNGLSRLVSAFSIREVLIPSVPKEFRLVYNALTGGAYTQTLNLFERRDIEIREIVEPTPFSDPENLWEWIVFPLLSFSDWKSLRDEMVSRKIKDTEIKDALYVDSNLSVLKECFLSAFGTAKMNENGLVMLSQAVKEPLEWRCCAYHGSRNSLSSLFHRTSAFFTGDANLKGRKKEDAMTFISRYCGRNKIGLVQIPHHGSRSNTSSSFVFDFPADVYYYQDSNSRRLLRNIGLYSKLVIGNNLYGVYSSPIDALHQCICFL